ncbi:MAG: porin [Sphingobium sp.]|nr:porin [Sphingobium sp.]
MLKWGVSLMLLAVPVPALAQQQGPLLEVAVMNDARVRGLSWSDGRAAAMAYVGVPVTSDITLSVQALSTRGAVRHGGADGVFDISGTYQRSDGPVHWHAGVTGHVFTGGDGPLNYAKMGGGAGITLGPVDMGVSASYAPSQRSIGGSLLYGQAQARVAVIGTPISLTGHVGRSGGSERSSGRWARLRPGGDYTDWALGAEYSISKLSVTLDWTDTDIEKQDEGANPFARHSGAVLTLGARISL